MERLLRLDSVPDLHRIFWHREDRVLDYLKKMLAEPARHHQIHSTNFGLPCVTSFADTNTSGLVIPAILRACSAYALVADVQIAHAGFGPVAAGKSYGNGSINALVGIRGTGYLFDDISNTW